MGSSEDISKTQSQYGFRIYNLVKDGPLYNGGAKEISDFIIPPPEFLSHKNSFNEWVLSLANKTITLKLYSLLSRNYKYIEIKTNPQGSKEGILGAAVKYENYLNADKNLLHIIAVKDDSFSEKKLGLIPDDDYIIAVKNKNTPIISLNKEQFNPIEILNTVISNNDGNEMMFYIYNKKKGFRLVETKLEKNENENKFTLGCDVAYGALHEFPMSEEVGDNNNNQIIKEENNQNENNESISNNGNDMNRENKIKEINESKEEIEEDII